MQKLRNILTLWKTIVPILTGQIAQTNVNVADSILIGEKMEREYIASLPNGFFNPSSGPITTMSVSKQQVKDKQFRLVIDLESIFLRLLMIGQQWQMEIEPVFACELCAVPPSLIDEHSVSAKQQVRPCQASWDTIHETVLCTAETIIVDVSQLFYHIVWPHGGSPSDIIASI